VSTSGQRNAWLVTQKPIWYEAAGQKTADLPCDCRTPIAGSQPDLGLDKACPTDYERLRTYGGRCGLHVTPHQLRHTAATLLLNAGAPILTVQAVLGHKHIDTTLGYARLYDGTVAADYYRAMDQVEARMALAGATDANDGLPTGGQLLALVDTLHDGTLNEDQRETVHVLRLGILALTELTTAHCGG